MQKIVDVVAKSNAALGVKAVDRDTALLFLTLREPGPLPSYVRSALGEATGRTIARLIADGVLEAEKDGESVWGPAALEVRETLANGTYPIRRL